MVNGYKSEDAYSIDRRMDSIMWEEAQQVLYTIRIRFCHFVFYDSSTKSLIINDRNPWNNC